MRRRMRLTHFFLLLFPGWIEESFALPLLLLFHVVVHRIVVSILVHGCWHNPPTADKQQGHDDDRTDETRRRPTDSVGYDLPATHLPLSSVVVVATAAADGTRRISAHQIPAFCCRDADGEVSWQRGRLAQLRRRLHGRLAVICVLATKEFSGRREGSGRHVAVGMARTKAAAAAAAVK